MAPETKPRPYVRPMNPTWWMANRHLFLWMLRELSSLFVGAYALFLLVMLLRAGNSERFHEFYVNVLLSPWVIGFKLVALVFVIYHGITTCTASPVLMVVWRGEEKLHPYWVIGANYVAWLVASAAVVGAALFLAR